MFDTDTPPASGGGGEDEKAEKKPELVYGSPEEFLHEQLLPTYVRSVTGKSAKWCIEWYFHPEAVSRVLPCGGHGSTSGSMLPRA